MSRGTPLRNVRIDDATWQRARERMEELNSDNESCPGGTMPSLSYVIRTLLDAWIAGLVEVHGEDDCRCWQ